MTNDKMDITQHDRPPSNRTPAEPTWQSLAEFKLPSELSSECLALEKVSAAVRAFNLPTIYLERLKTAVAEATLNAIEHGNRYRSDAPVVIRVLASEKALLVRVTDQGNGGPIARAEVPDLAAKVAGRQSPRGWGFFLIEKLVDDLRVTIDDAHHTIELFLYLEGGKSEPSSF